MNIVEGTERFAAWTAGASRFSRTRKKLLRKRSVLWLRWGPRRLHVHLLQLHVITGKKQETVVVVVFFWGRSNQKREDRNFLHPHSSFTHYLLC